ncbi:dihydroorotase [Rhizobium mayense]|uniref:Dihydroorotase family protein n=1 Tax=Rhizobium mayense TaxID=1312184 RepID=A0ABT7K405_9HYPH|nr:dihydroorotase family protein [Rhizobium mayense]MDL2403327.1 dihydroorotase family protein [Rhizobium mayense]
MFDTVITGGTVVNADGQHRADVAIRDGRIAALLVPGETAMARSFIEAGGKYLMPGLVDAHAHLREPGLTQKEDFDSGSRAAALGGVTTILDMPTDDPWTATPRQLAEKMAMGLGRLHVDVGFQAVVSRSHFLLEDLLKLGPVSLELFTADVPADYLFDSLEAVTQTLRQIAPHDIVVGVSPGDQSILLGSALRNRAGDIGAFLESRPPLAEASGVARAVIAAAETGARVHVRQVNSRLGIETWRKLRDMADVTIETTPQNLFFAADDYEIKGSRLKGSPPFRAREDVQALRAALSEGAIDIMATDHAPHSPAEKAVSYPAFADIPGGMPGLQTLLPVMLKLVGEDIISLSALVRMCSHAPARRFGLGRSKGAIAVGYDADLLVVDLAGSTVLRNAEQASRAGYTPFDGWRIPAALTAVFLHGERIVEGANLTSLSRGQVVRSSAA